MLLFSSFWIEDETTTEYATTEDSSSDVTTEDSSSDVTTEDSSTATSTESSTNGTTCQHTLLLSYELLLLLISANNRFSTKIPDI